MSLGVFFSKYAILSDAMRLDHLASLGLDFNGKSVLEVGAGIGLLTAFFEVRGCQVLSTDGRPENVEVMRRLWPNRRVAVLDLDHEMDIARLGYFNVVFCYGVVYHLEDPAKALGMLSKVCTEMALIESKITAKKQNEKYPRAEPAQPDQALYGVGCRPTKLWLTDVLCRHFDHVYIAKNPSHSLPGDRAVFVGSWEPIGPGAENFRQVGAKHV